MDMSKNTSLKDHTKMVINNSTTNSPKNHSLNYINQITTSYEDQEDYMINNAFSWPPRSYTCSFCKREFRSAQALGGHMNVHRKDRARLRQSPPSDLLNGRYSNTTTFLNLNLNQSPNPNFPGTTTTLNITTNISQPPLSSLIDQSKKIWPTQLNNSSNNHDIMKSKVLEGFEGKREFNYNNFKNLKSMKIGDEKTKKSTVRLDLEIGLLCEHNSENIGRDLDLELRLGYSN